MFVGQSLSGKVLSDKDCRHIMRLPVLEFSQTRDNENFRNSFQTRMLMVSSEDLFHPLDKLVPKENYLQEYVAQWQSIQAEEIEKIKRMAVLEKTALERELEGLAKQIKAAETGLAQSSDRMSKITADKTLKLLNREWHQKQDSLFLDKMRIDLMLEENIQAFIESQKFTVKLSRQYVITVNTKKAQEKH